MRKRLFATVLAAVVAAVTVAACGSSSSGGSSGSGSGGKVTLKLVAADYGTGPAQHQPQVLAGDRRRLPQGEPDRSPSRSPSSPGPTSTTQVQTMVQNKQYPDITEGDYFSNYAQEGLLYPASRRPLRARQPAAGLRQAGHLQRHPVRHAVHDQLADSVLQQEAVRARRGSARRRRPGPTSRPTRRRSRRWARSASASRSAPRRRRPSRCCGCSATAATTGHSGKWTINSSPNVDGVRSSSRAWWRRATPSPTRAPRTAPTCGSSSRRARSA